MFWSITTRENEKRLYTHEEIRNFIRFLLHASTSVTFLKVEYCKIWKWAVGNKYYKKLQRIIIDRIIFLEKLFVYFYWRPL